MYTLTGCRKVIHPIPAHLERQKRHNQYPIKNTWRRTSEQAQMYIQQITGPGHRSPCFFRVPTPIVSPGCLGPYRSCKHADRQKRKSGINQLIGSLQVVYPTFEESHARQNKGAAQHGIRKHINGYMRDKPWTLQGRHKGLVVNFRFQYID